MERAAAMNFVKDSVTHAMARDGSSGGIVRLVVIDSKGAERVYNPGNELKVCFDEIPEPKG